ncbi:unnamed protein product [Calypogeia fissa]
MSDVAKTKSEHLSNARAKVKNPQVTGRAGTASIIEELKQISGHTPTKAEVQSEAQKRASDNNVGSKEVTRSSSTLPMIIERLKELEDGMVEVENRLNNHLDLVEAHICNVIESQEQSFGQVIDAIAKIHNLISIMKVSSNPHSSTVTMTAGKETCVAVPRQEEKEMDVEMQTTKIDKNKMEGMSTKGALKVAPRRNLEASLGIESSDDKLTSDVAIVGEIFPQVSVVDGEESKKDARRIETAG